MKKHWMTLGGLASAGLAQAQAGHGLSGLSHWPAVDVGVPLALAAVLAFAAVLGLGLRRLRHTPGPR